jgi:hypothetical protein
MLNRLGDCGSPDHSHRRPGDACTCTSGHVCRRAATVVDDHSVTAYTTDHEPREQVACGMPTPAVGPSLVLQQRFEQLCCSRGMMASPFPRSIAMMRPVAGDQLALLLDLLCGDPVPACTGEPEPPPSASMSLAVLRCLSRWRSTRRRSFSTSASAIAALM